jgi:hypothetical protein
MGDRLTSRLGETETYRSGKPQIFAFAKNWLLEFAKNVDAASGMYIRRCQTSQTKSWPVVGFFSLRNMHGAIPLKAFFCILTVMHVCMYEYF